MNLGALPVVLFLVFLSACEPQAQSSSDQWVAKWGAGSISRAELDWGLAQAGGPSGETPEHARARALESLVNQKLVASAAERQGLAKLPDVELEAEFARRQVLVRAFARRLGRNIPKPTGAAIEDYYRRYPQLFSHRRVYQMEEIHVQANPAQRGAIQEQLARSANLTELVAWLGAQGMRGSILAGFKPAEQLPEAMRNQMANMNAGQIALVPATDGVAILHVQRIEDQPLTLEQATPVIEKILAASAQKQRFDAELEKLREAARIEYASGMQQTAKQ